MSEATETTTTTKTESQASSIVDTIFDIGTGWAAHGLTLGKLALQQSAKTLEATAKALEKLATELDSKEKTEKTAPKA